MRPVRGVALALCVWAACCACARADAGVVLREQPGLRAGLCGSLRIQLSGVAEVRCEPEPPSAGLSERIAAAAARVKELAARLGVLIERDPDPTRVRMYLVSAERDQAVIAIERIEDRPEPDVDRSLALKVMDAYELVDAVRAVAPARADPLLASLAAPDPGAGAHLWQLFVEAGGGALVGSDLRGTASVSIGVAQTRRHLRVEVGAGARFVSRREVQRSVGEISLRERGPQLTLRVLWRSGRVELGGVLEGTLALTSAEGRARDGSAAEALLLTPGVGLGVDLRLRLFSSAYLRLAPVLEALTIDRHLAIDRQVLVDAGSLRAILPVSLLISLPLRAARDVQP